MSALQAKDATTLLAEALRVLVGAIEAEHSFDSCSICVAVKVARISLRKAGAL